MNQKEKDFCLKLFSLSSCPTIGELKKRYRELIKMYHPDKHPENIEWSTRMVQQLNEAYELLLAHLHRLFSGAPVFGSFHKGKSTPIKNIEEIILMGDDALRDAVIIGWLKRTPKDDFAQSIRKTVEKVCYMLESVESKYIHTGKIVFFSDLFSVFLKPTAQNNPRPLPEVYNATKFFHHFATANNYLDSGIRNYYRFTENGRKLTLQNIPLSFLEDAIRLFALLKRKIKDVVMKEKIQAKIELAELFKLRIQNQDFTLL